MLLTEYGNHSSSALNAEAFPGGFKAVPTYFFYISPYKAVYASMMNDRGTKHSELWIGSLNKVNITCSLMYIMQIRFMQISSLLGNMPSIIL